MRILIFSPYEQPEGQTSRNYDYAIRLVRSGHEVSVVTNNFCHRTHKRFVDAVDQNFSITSFRGVRVVWLNTSEYYDNGIKRAINAFSFLLKGHRYLKSLDKMPDVVIGDSVPPTAGLIAYWSARKFGCRFIYQIRDVWPIALVFDGALKKNGVIYWVLRAIEIFLYRRAHRICSTVKNLHSHVSEAGASEDKVVWIPNGVDLERFPYAPQNNKTAGTVVVGYAGGFGNAHDVLTIIKSAHILQLKGIPCRFMLYGDGVKRKVCESYVETNGLSNVKFFDPVPRDEIPSILSGMDVLVAALTDSDAYKFGINLNKMYDYFAAGKPVVFSCRTEDDPVRAAQCGRSIPPERPEEMAKAFEDLVLLGGAERGILGGRARGYAEEFYNIEVLAERFEGMLSSTDTLL
jgi:glycosyltransferase involved in cell wall biosynthesis